MVFGGWLGGVTNIFVIYLGGGVDNFFPKGLGGRQMFCPPHENVTAPPPPHLVINDSSLIIPNLVPQMRISVFNLVSVA